MSRRLLTLAIFVFLAAALLFVQLPFPGNYAGRTIRNAGHMPLFLLGTWFVIAILRHDFQLTRGRLYLLTGVLGIGAGFLTEVVQRVFRRDPSWEDVLADCVGVMLAITLHALFERESKLRGPPRVAALLIVAGCLLTYIAPFATMVRAYVHRNGQFPVLASFHSRAELPWIVGYGVTREMQDGVLEVVFEHDTFPGFSFYEPVPDWRTFRELAMDVENPEAEVFHLGVRVHDIGHGRTYADRFTRVFELAAGERRTVRIPLDDIRRGPRNRLMDLSKVSDVTLFRGQNLGSRRLRLHGMRLE